MNRQERIMNRQERIMNRQGAMTPRKISRPPRLYGTRTTITIIFSFLGALGVLAVQRTNLRRTKPI